MTTPDFDGFTLACLEAALWSSTGAAGEPLNREHDIADIDQGVLERLAADCKRFQASPAWQAVLASEDDPRTARRQGYGCALEKARALTFGLRGADMARAFGMATGRSRTLQPSIAFRGHSATSICTSAMTARFTARNRRSPADIRRKFQYLTILAIWGQKGSNTAKNANKIRGFAVSPVSSK